MRNRSSHTLLSVLLVAVSALADQGSDRQAALRGLEREIAAARGLTYKSAVAVRSSKDGTIGYDAATKSLLLPDNGRWDRDAVGRALVHALLDQHFDLAGLRKKVHGTDAQLALDALIEGDATWTIIALRQKEDPKTAPLPETPLEKAANLRQAFVQAQGTRYVRALVERGGWKRVDSAYRFPPRTTASILHPEGVATIDLGPGASRGELGWIEELARHPETRSEAVRSVAGWQGDRRWEDGDKKAWLIAFASPSDAERFQRAWTRGRTAGTGELPIVESRTGGNAWRDRNGRIVASHLVHDRVYLLEAPDLSGYHALLEAVTGPPALTIHARKEESALSFGALIDRLMEADFVCVGETHDSDLHHRVQHQIVKALFARDERLGVGFEMFQRPFQAALDRYGWGEMGEDDFLKTTEYHERWGFAWSLYRPIVDFCRHNRAPLAALNAPKELTARIARVGHAALTDAEKQQLGPIDFQRARHRDYWFDRLAAMHGQKNAPAEQKERGYQVMATWDHYMAASAAEFRQERHLRRLVILAGSGHIERWFGIPERVGAQTAGKVLTVGIQIGGDPDAFRREPITDFLVIVR